MLAPLALKKRIEIPKTPRGDLVSIIHPAVGQAFLEFPSSPTLSGDYGVHLGLILDACCIMTQNEKGRLTSDQKGLKPVSSQDVELWLPPGIYYYHLHGRRPEFSYPLCSDFNAWEPPVKPPRRWRDPLSPEPEPVIDDVGSDASGFTRKTDASCLLTGFTIGLNASHLVPRANGPWFDFHQLRLEIPGTDRYLAFDSPANMVTLLSVLNDGIDASYFTFIPMSGKYAAYALRQAPQLMATLHTQEVDFPKRIPVKFIYCRFAWNIINRARETMQTTTYLFKQVPVPAALQTAIDNSKSKKRKVDHAEKGDKEAQADAGGGGAGEGGGGAGEGGRGEGGRGEGRAGEGGASEGGTGEGGAGKGKDESEMDEDGSVQSGSSFPSFNRYTSVIPPSQWTFDALKESQKYDEKLKTYGDQTIDETSVYPGFSDIHAVAVKYVSENRAATDPGGARVATLAEILAEDE